MSRAARTTARAHSLAGEAAELLAAALAEAHALHHPGARSRYRDCLLRTIALGEQALAESSELLEAKLTLIRAYAAHASDARHGVGQLSRGAQRAPTVADCDDGWQRVEEIAAGAEGSAAKALALAGGLDSDEAQKAAAAAEASAREARRIVDERNHAYTFHTDRGFSFGEGWHLAAAALLAGAAIQIEPGKPQEPQVSRFVHDAGLGDRLSPYRPRPRAPKQLTEIVARAFRADPAKALRRVRASFLGEAAIPQPIAEFVAAALAGTAARKKILLWVRTATHHPDRNTTASELAALVELARSCGLVPILFGDAVPDGEPVPPGSVDMTLCWKQPLFQGEDMRRAQLQLFEQLRVAHGLVGQIGVTTAGMDGPALLGLPTIYLTAERNPRMFRWVGAVPGYREVIREHGYLDTIAAALRRWEAS